MTGLIGLMATAVWLPTTALDGGNLRSGLWTAHMDPVRPTATGYIEF